MEIKSTHRERFSTIYLSQLDYFITSGHLPPFAPGKRESMLAGILDGSAMIDGPACKAHMPRPGHQEYLQSYPRIPREGLIHGNRPDH